MLPVIQFSWRQLEPLLVDRLTGAELLRLPSLPYLRIVHDLSTRRSLVVDVEQAKGLVRAYPGSESLHVMDTAVGPTMAFGQMAVPHGLPASFVAVVAEWHRAGYVVVEGNDHRPVGLFSPSTVSEVLAETSMVTSAQAAEDVRHALHEAGLAGALDLVEARFEDFHSEQLNVIAPAAPWCDAGAGHWVAFCPCDDHPGAGCRRRADLV